MFYKSKCLTVLYSLHMSFSILLVVVFAILSFYICDVKHVSILVPQGHSIIDTVIAPYNLLRMANTIYKKIHHTKEDQLHVDLVSVSLEPITYHRQFTVQPTATLDHIKRTDLIIIAAIDGRLEREIERNQAYVPWIREQRISNGADIASLCKGAFILADTGLLNGKKCSTHWTAHNQFTRLYPEVELIPEKIITEDNGIYSSGGAYSFLNFTIYLIERYLGREVAIRCSKFSEIDIDRIDQSPFSIFHGQKDHGDEAILKAQLYIEDHHQDKIPIPDLAELSHMSERTFLRRFKKLTANTPAQYIQRVKVEAAKKMLESTTLQIQQVMFDVGYNDFNAFRKIFKKFAGLSPQAYQRKYNREASFA